MTSVMWENLTNESKGSQTYKRVPLVWFYLEQARLIWKLIWKLIVVTLGEWNNRKRHKGTFDNTFDNRAADSVLFLDPCLELGVLTLWKYIDLHTYDTCSFLCAYCSWIKRKEDAVSMKAVFEHWSFGTFPLLALLKMMYHRNMRV